MKYWKENSGRTAMWARSLRRGIYKVTHGKADQHRVAMFHAGRCGSSVVADMLSQHTDVHWANEVFENMLPGYYNMNPQARAYHRIANAIHPPQKKYFGFETKYLPEQHLRYELANHSLENYVAMLAKEFGIKQFILLNRENHLRRAISITIGQKTGQWHSRSDTSTNKVHLPVNGIISYGQSFGLTDFFDHLDTHYSLAKKILSQFELLELSYEADIEPDPNIGYKACCEFMGLPPQKTETRLKRQNPKKAKDLITNFDEVSQALSGTKYEWMLDA